MLSFEGESDYTCLGQPCIKNALLEYIQGCGGGYTQSEDFGLKLTKGLERRWCLYSSTASKDGDF